MVVAKAVNDYICIYEKFVAGPKRGRRGGTYGQKRSMLQMKKDVKTFDGKKSSENVFLTSKEMKTPACDPYDSTCMKILMATCLQGCWWWNKLWCTQAVIFFRCPRKKRVFF